MTSKVHGFEARVDGPFRVSLTYDARTDTGKTSAQTAATWSSSCRASGWSR